MSDDFTPTSGYMQVLDPSVGIMSITPNAEVHMELCARECYNSVDKMKEGSHIGFLCGAIKRGHFSILSHAHVTFKIEGISRACSHQFVRHAHIRYLQKSQRYCSEEGNDYKVHQYVVPESIDDTPFHEAMEYAWKKYKDFKETKAKNEDARYVLPNACKTTIIASATLQGWWDFLRLRMDKHAQWEIRDVAKMIYRLLNAYCPNVFNPELIIVQPKLNLEFPDE